MKKIFSLILTLVCAGGTLYAGMVFLAGALVFLGIYLSRYPL